MLDYTTISIMRYAHAIFGGLMLLAFFFQGSLGWRIRRHRVSGAPQNASAVRRHRRWGPLLVAVGLMAYPGGLFLVLAGPGRTAVHPLHLAGATTLAILLAALFFSARRIRSLRSPWRNVHAALGLLALLFYLHQSLTGLLLLT